MVKVDGEPHAMVREFKTRVAKVGDLLNRHKVRYLIVGAEACNVHGLVRGTKDVDVLLEKSKENVEKALQALSQLTFGVAKEFSAEEILAKPFSIIGDNPRVDILFKAGNLKYESAQADFFVVEVEGVRIPFAGLQDLILSKQTERTKDKADLEVLEQLL